MSTQAAIEPAPPRLFRALRHRNFRLFFSGQAISLIGNWLTKIAMGWLVYELAAGPEGATTPEAKARAASLLGLVAFSASAPMFALAPFGGVLVDRFNRHRVIVLTQVLAMLQSGTLGVLVLGHWITIPQVIALALFQGFVDAIDTPARQAFVVEMVDDPVDLANAIALNSSIFNTARCLGPALAGVLLFFNVSPGWCFAGDSASYIAVIIGLLMMRLKPLPPHAHTGGALEAFKSGVRYTFGFPPLRSILFLVGTSSFTAAGLSTLMPLFADAMASGPHGAARYGLLMAFTGIGALSGAIYLAQRKTVVGLARVMCLASVLMGAGMSLFVLTHDFYLGSLLCIFVGFGMVTHFASGNTLLQSITEDAMRGRVMSFFAMFVIGMSPFGALLAGWLSKPLGPRLVVVLYAAIGIAAAIWFLRQLPRLRPLIRPIYVKKGIIPEVAVALAMEEREER